MGTVHFRRRPRKWGPALPAGELELKAPPELPQPAQRSMTQVLQMLPMFLLFGAMALMYTTRRGFGGPMLVIGGLFVVAMLAMVATSFLGGGRGGDRHQMTNDRRDYMRYLTQARRRVRRAAVQQRAAMLWSHPRPGALWNIAASPRLWERRITDEDFCEVRVAVGRQRLAVSLKTEETKPVEDLEPMSAMALRRFVKAQSTVRNLPMAIQLRGFRRVRVHGDDAAARASVRAMLAQLVTFHAPEDLCLAVVADPGRRKDWEWVKWLPHNQHEDAMDAAGPRRLIAGSLTELETLLDDTLAGRSRGTAQVSPVHEGRHVVLIQDGGEIDPAGRLTGPGLSGTTVIEFGSRFPRRMPEWLVGMEVTADSVTMTYGEGRTPMGTPDRMSLNAAEALARQISRFRLATATATAEPLAVSMDLPDLLGVRDIGGWEPRRTWRPHQPAAERLVIPLGLDPNGGKVTLDFKEAAQGGMGPHGLIIGATGSGKSELLRTIVSALAITHSSEELNFVLVDFKGGATFATLDRLPHTSAVITNLEDELALVDRMADAINGEIVRRQELLRDAGNYVSQRDYERERRAGAALAPLPSLLVICDEFSELLTARPEFINLFVQIGRVGRSLGVHLLLASQRLEEGRLRGLDTHLSYRIGLRTFSAIESRTVLGVPDAYELPQAPGHGYLKIDQDTMLRFRAAYVSGPYRRVRRQRGTPGTGSAPDRVVSFDSTHRPLEVEAPVPVPAGPDQEEPQSSETLMAVLVDRVEGKGPPAHRVWLPPLGPAPSLDGLFPRLEVTPERGLHAPDWPGGTLRFPIGHVDRPFEQRRDLLTIDLSGSGGHFAVVGGPQSGKSTVLRAVAGSIALTHTPAEFQIYGIDLGGGALRALRNLPHVGGTGSRQQPEVVRRILAQVLALIDEREATFAEEGIDTMATYRQARAEGRVEDPYGDVLVVIDGWPVFKEEFTAQMDQVFAIAQRGLAYGVHLAVGANRWTDMRPPLRDLFGTRVELRLGDAIDSEIDRKAAKNVPDRSPGRGLVEGGHAVLTALPRIDGRNTVDDLIAGMDGFVTRAEESWTATPAPAVKLLPRRLPFADVPAYEPGREVHFGIDEARLAPVGIDFSVNPHFVILGDSESGKTNLLRVLIGQLCRSEAEKPPKFVVVDYRRTLLGEVEPADRLVSYSADSATAATSVAEFAAALRQRLPGPDITPERLYSRDWWTGSDVYFVVDDYDLVAAQKPNPVHALIPLLPQARDIGLHLIVARRMGGASRGLLEPALQALRELQTPTLMLSGSPDEGPLFGRLRPSIQPPGRGTLIRREGAGLIHTALRPSKFTRDAA
ncbi:S-DNA-T family DNA segregation ATPase FtsK/SpoIIIE [Stackebrandtia albiflava]|uniref:S-DNA-T family DNA segregation ATPase FtsK/SpoIIIE n=1 Tax=Stackebrandtia albiflava TaxID=406432 RepID=A0A562VC13_9ACTN|nr:type VII secretion protein EccCa [Stackebrandtia albiflava]TWJ15402.1 S-DNA-T family DNA segregation ATPase FtsK/SpoIIIE [Stackebrandtia albiflava]